MNHTKYTNDITDRFHSLVADILSTRPDFESSFNTKDLPYYHNFNKEKAPNVVPEMRYFFEGLDKIKHHALYYFELDNIEKAHQLNKLIDNYRKPVNERKTNYRVVPASNKYDNSESKILYLGVRQGNPNQKARKLTNLVGRVNQHLGYYSNGSTQGLQLYHYARGEDFKITLKVYEFQNLDKTYLNVIEKMMAQQLKPLCGRH